MLTEKQSHTVAWALAALVFGLLVIKNSGLASPLLAGDEYAYFAHALSFPSSADAHDPNVQAVFNPLFSAIGHAMITASRYPERMMTAFNVVMFAAAVLGVVFLARRLSSGSGIVVPAIVAALSPLAANTAYFMPEWLYFVLALAVLLVLSLGYQRAPIATAAGAGALVGALLLVKSHALSVVGAGVLSIATMGWLFERPFARRTGLALLSFVGAAWASTFVLLYCLTHEVVVSPRTFLGIYAGFVSTSVEAQTWTQTFVPMVGNFLGHAVVALCVAAPPLGALVLILFRAIQARRKGELPPDSAGRVAFAVVALALLCGALAMTVVFTASADRSGQSDQLLRLHGRYYSYALLPIVVAYFALRDVVLSSKDIRVLAVVGLCASLAMLMLRAKFNIYPWDYPEAFVFTAWSGVTTTWLAYAAIAIGIMTYAVAVWRPDLSRLTYPGFLIAAYVLANLAVSAWQREHSAGNERYSNAGRALKAVLGDVELERTLVVAPEHYGNAPLAHFLFGLAANPHVVIKPIGERIDQSVLPSAVAHVVTLGGYTIGLPHRASLGVADWQLFEIGGSGPRLRLTADLWDGHSFQVLPGIGRDTSVLDGFNEPEAWGAWTAVDPAVIELPVLVSGPLRLLVDGWVPQENTATDVDLEIGTAHATVRFGDARGIRCVTLNVAQPSHELVIRGAVPRRPDAYQRALGLAVTRAVFARPGDKSVADACTAAQAGSAPQAAQ